MHTNRRYALLPLLALGVTLLFIGILPSVAGAHASMVRSDPSNGSLVGPALGRVVAWFDLPLQTEPSTIQVFDATGNQVDLGEGRVDPADASRKSMIAKLPVPLAPGAYVAHWHAVSDEGLHTGHVTEGEFSFWVDASAGQFRPGWALAGLGVLGAVASAFVLIRANVVRAG